MTHSASAATLLLHYTFDESNNGSEPAADLGASPAAPGSFLGTAVRTANTPNSTSLGALDLTSTSTPDYVTAGDADKLDGLEQLTLTAWINLQGAPVNGNRIMAKQLGTGNFDGFSFAYSTPTTGTISADNFQLNLALGGVGGFAFNTSGVDLGAANRWVFVAVTYDGTQIADNLQFWSGSEVDAVSPLDLPRSVIVGALMANANEFRVGASSTGAVSPPEYVDDVRVYSGVLTSAELEAVRFSNVPEPSAVAAVTLSISMLGLRRSRRVR
jgi:hypothetical protein